MTSKLIEICSRLHVDRIAQESVGILPHMHISGEIRDPLVHSCTGYLVVEG